MSVIGDIINFFRGPRYQTSAFGPVWSSIVKRLRRTGVNVGGTAAYPRVEVYEPIEGARLDKDGSLRQLTFTIESTSAASMADAIAMNEENLRLFTETGLETPKGWKCLGILPDQLQGTTETSDTNKILYRQIQTVNVWIERI